MDTFSIITKLGGRGAVFEKLKAHGFLGSIHALRMWGARRSIPGDAIVLLLKIAEAEDIATCADDFEPSALAVEAAE